VPPYRDDQTKNWGLEERGQTAGEDVWIEMCETPEIREITGEEGV
jgi:hypothetical protein